MEPAGAFLALWSGVPAGTALACTYGPVAWIAMVLVDDKLRRRGIGGELMRRALAFLEESGVRSVRLDATPLGQPLYTQLGFQAEYSLARQCRRAGASAEPAVSEVEPFRVEFTQAVFELDRSVTGADRSKFLRRVLTELPDGVRLVHARRGLAGTRRRARSAGHDARPVPGRLTRGAAFAGRRRAPPCRARGLRRCSGRPARGRTPFCKRRA